MTTRVVLLVICDIVSFQKLNKKIYAHDLVSFIVGLSAVNSVPLSYGLMMMMAARAAIKWSTINKNTYLLIIYIISMFLLKPITIIKALYERYGSKMCGKKIGSICSYFVFDYFFQLYKKIALAATFLTMSVIWHNILILLNMLKGQYSCNPLQKYCSQLSTCEHL